MQKVSCFYYQYQFSTTSDLWEMFCKWQLLVIATRTSLFKGIILNFRNPVMGLLLEINHNGSKECSAHPAEKPWVLGSSLTVLTLCPWSHGQAFRGVWHHPLSSGKSQGWLHPVSPRSFVPVGPPSPRPDGSVFSPPVKLSQERDAGTYLVV